MQGGCVPNRVRRDVPIAQTHAFDRRRSDGALQNLISSISREPCPTNTWEHELLRFATQFAKPDLQCAGGFRPQRHGSLLAPFAVQLQKSAGTELHLITMEAGDLRDPCPAVIERQQQGMVT